MCQTHPFQLFFLILLTISLLTFTCCKKDTPCNDKTNEECPNYDPCWDRENLTADFKMETPIRSDGVWEVFDTTVFMPVIADAAPGNIIFTALDEYADSYYWQIGDNSENDRFTRSFRMSFACEFKGQTIPVKLITQRITDTLCPQWNMATDTVLKEITLIKAEDVLAITQVEGHFEGYLERYPDIIYTLEVKINQDCDIWLNCLCRDTVYEIHNLLNFNCGAFYPYTLGTVTSTASVTVNSLSANGTSSLKKERDGCPFPEGIETLQAEGLLIRMESEDRIRIDVRQKYLSGFGQPGSYVQIETFIGRRVN